MRNYVLILLVLVLSCKKPFSALYEATDVEQVSLLTDTCFMLAINSRNFNEIEESFTLSYNQLSKGSATSLVSFNSVLNNTKIGRRVFINDTLSIFDGDSIFLTGQKKYVDRIVTSKKPFELEFDQYEHRFIYKDSLLDSRLMYVNGDSTPYFESRYSYTDNQLVGIEMFFKPNNQLIFQTKLTYKKDVRVKPWLYLYTDFFSLSEHLLVFNFGVMPLGILTDMEAVYFDTDGLTKLGDWKVKFSNYKISKDNYVLRVSSIGQRIQSLPYLFQNTEFKYQCKK
jgi:hypothetical protein